MKNVLELFPVEPFCNYHEIVHISYNLTRGKEELGRSKGMEEKCALIIALLVKF